VTVSPESRPDLGVTVTIFYPKISRRGARAACGIDIHTMVVHHQKLVFQETRVPSPIDLFSY
jgi:hypothetical protein